VTQPNPLQRFFRQPAIYIQLPSEGKYYPDGSITIPPNRELPVYPMTAMDEITYRTADALFNGSAVINVIKSCVPNIVDPWQMPTVDMDAVLVGIRIASYGHELELESRCPHCEEENTFAVDLRTIMDQIRLPDYNASVQSGDIEIFFKPLNYQQQNQNSVKQFEDQKMLQAIPDADIPEQEKLDLINSALIKLGELSINAISQSISVVKAGNDIVNDTDHIHEFVKNCDRKIYNALRDTILNFKDQTALKPLKVQCNTCAKPYETPFTLDVSNFFVQDS
jgi:hypothetical protein